MDQNSYGIHFLQNNPARNPNSMITCLEIGIELGTDFILFQEPWVAQDNSYTISHPSYNAILPEQPPANKVHPRVTIFHRKLSKFQFCQRTDLNSDSDLLIIDILGSQIPDLQLINIYNEKSLKEPPEWTVERALSCLVPSQNTLIGGDFNAHHSWWNSDIDSPIRADALVQWLEEFDFELVSEPDLPTFHRNGMVNKSIIDLVFATKRLDQVQ